MSNILINMDMSSKHVHFYPEIGFHIKDQSSTKSRTKYFRKTQSSIFKYSGKVLTLDI